jgi:hypothetical protein
MLVDMTRCDREISQLIFERCASSSIVRSVKIHRHPRPFALVELSNQHEASKLGAQYRRPPINDCVLIYLKHKIEDEREKLDDLSMQSSSDQIDAQFIIPV